MFYTYILRCSDGSYYTGHTDTLDIRIDQHQAGTLGGYTHFCRPIELVWSQEFPTRLEALTAERKLKGWSRAKKEALIGGDWKLVSALSRNRSDELTLSSGTRAPSPALKPVRAEPVEALLGTVPNSASTGSARTDQE